VQGVLAPVQFLICVASAALILRYLATGEGYGIATASIILKTAALLAIMVTGSIWEKEVFGVWLFAPPFFWEDVVSFVVIGLHGAYVAALATGALSPSAQMGVALAAYAAYAVNASQFLLKLRAARLGAQAAGDRDHEPARPFAGAAS
jgi:3-vinyl bacteriochlorophyllide hydratase